jgi:hypothetical protein
VPSPAVKFLVCALFHGDHPTLAQRCAGTLRRLWLTGRVDMRIGANEVSPRTAQILSTLLPDVPLLAADPQLYKYPMMRRLLREYDVDATHLMWFDDDSALLPGTAAGPWLEAVATRAATTQGTLGAPYVQPLSGPQQAWLRAQPWFTGRPIGDHALFTTGGWWVAPLALLRRFDWPPTSLRHNGGDVALGVLLQQHGLEIGVFRAGLAINADEALAECRAPRRGFSESLPEFAPATRMAA